MNNIKCPVCQNNLHKINRFVSTCTNDKCKLWGASIPNLVLEALTQAKQDLKTARWVMKDIDALLLSRKFDITELGRLNLIQSLVSRALKATEHKEQQKTERKQIENDD